jgi:hypothetical protein
MTPVIDLLRFSAVSMDLLASARLSPQALAARQRDRLNQLLASTLRESRFYREHLRGSTPGTVSLSGLPPVTRQALMDRFDDWVTDPALTLAALRAFTSDPQRIGEPYLGKYLIWESSGTSHQPGIFVQDSRVMAVYDALDAQRRSAPRPMQRWLDPMMLAERIAFVGATSGHFASYVTMQRLHELYPWLVPSVRCFSILQPTRALVAELNEFKPSVLATYPTAAMMLVDQAQCAALNFVPSEVWTGGETLSATARRSIEAAFGCTVRNSYGASEFMPIAWECRQGQLHVNADWVIGSTMVRLSITPQCRCGPVTRPVAPTLQNALAGAQGVAHLHVDAAQVAIHGEQALAVVQPHGAAVEEIVARVNHLARQRRHDGRAGGGGNVHAAVRIARLAVEHPPQPERAGAPPRHRHLHAQDCRRAARGKGSLKVAITCAWWSRSRSKRAWSGATGPPCGATPSGAALCTAWGPRCRPPARAALRRCGSTVMCASPGIAASGMPTTAVHSMASPTTSTGTSAWPWRAC